MKTFISGILVLLAITMRIQAQDNYKVLFASEMDDAIYELSKGFNDEYNIITTKNYWGGGYDTSSIVRKDIYSLHNNLADSIRWPVSFNRLDTTLFPASILYDESSYLVAGGAVVREVGEDTTFTRYQYIARFGLNKQILWEHLYPRPQELIDYWCSGSQRILKLKSGNYLTVARVRKLGGAIEKWLIQSYSPVGDTLQTRVFDDYLAGYIESLTYNYDSSEILVHATNGHIPGCDHLLNAGRGAVILDTIIYDTLGGICYEPNFHIQRPYEAMFNPAGNLVISGETWIYNIEEQKMDEYFGVYVLDTNYNVASSILLTDEDRKFKAAEFKCMDITANGDIYLAGILDRNPVFFPQTYNYIYLAKLDSELNILTERIFGGDAYYYVLNMLTTTDGGIILSGMQYDYMVNGWGDHDAFVIKTNDDLLVTTTESQTITSHSALVYPNPGNGKLYVRTTEMESLFVLYNLSGQVVQQTAISSLITEVDCNPLNKGVFVWKLLKNNRVIDHGKWIKIK
ncbi:MAG: T9SS type A sorting domain-containing protein [Bacteroidetes bacterium]|nr:T9SS type A sorting domain-containing protein [Bacteroidota bacterium]